MVVRCPDVASFPIIGAYPDGRGGLKRLFHVDTRGTDATNLCDPHYLVSTKLFFELGFGNRAVARNLSDALPR